MLENHFKESEKTWDNIADSFNNTRKKPWEECIDFIKNLSISDVVADIGCGNGRHTIVAAEYCKKVFGIDISKKLLNIIKNKTRQKNLENVILVHGNVVELPIKDNSLDAILYIASLHNIKGRKNRILSLKEINRTLKEDGMALISVWSRWQDKYRPIFLKKIFKRRNQNEFGDIDIHWRQNNLNVPRFYHLYGKREFISDLKQANLKIIKFQSIKKHSKISSDNYFAVVKKGNCY